MKLKDIEDLLPEDCHLCGVLSSFYLVLSSLAKEFPVRVKGGSDET